MLTLQTHFSEDGHPSTMHDRPQRDPFVRLGDETNVVVHRRDGFAWETMAFGIPDYEYAGRLSHAREDQLETVERWAMAVNRRVAFPICGYRWLSGGEWTRVAPGWALGFHEDGCFVTVSPSKPESWPIVGSWADAEAWLTARHWEALDVLRGVATRLAA